MYYLFPPPRRFTELKHYSDELQSVISHLLRVRAVSISHVRPDKWYNIFIRQHFMLNQERELVYIFFTWNWVPRFWQWEVVFIKHICREKVFLSVSWSVKQCEMFGCNIVFGLTLVMVWSWLEKENFLYRYFLAKWYMSLQSFISKSCCLIHCFIQGCGILLHSTGQQDGNLKAPWKSLGGTGVRSGWGSVGQ